LHRPRQRHAQCTGGEHGHHDSDQWSRSRRRAGRAGQRARHRGLAVDVPRLSPQEERYRRCFAGGWYLTGDLARRDADGYYWFVGRADDVIKSAGHLIGPFEVESALLEHPTVAEAAVIGVPDPIAGEVVRAFVTLKPGVAASDPLRDQLLGFARIRLGPAVAPRAIDLVADLPRTGSGKLMRRLLRARVLGLPEGDLSTLETSRELDLDSMDYQRFLSLLAARYRLEIPEVDVPGLATVEQIAAYVAARQVRS